MALARQIFIRQNFSRRNFEAFRFLHFAAEQEAMFLVGAQHEMRGRGEHALDGGELAIHKFSDQFRDVFVLVFFDKHAEDFHHRSERMVFIFAHFVHETVELLHKLAVFALVVRLTYYFLSFHLPASYSAWVSTARIYTFRRL